MKRAEISFNTATKELEKLEGLLEEVKDFGVPVGMTDEAYFDVIVNLEDAIEKAQDDGE